MTTEGTKRCYRCHVRKPIDGYYVSKDGRRATCKTCMEARAKVLGRVRERMPRKFYGHKDVPKRVWAQFASETDRPQCPSCGTIAPMGESTTWGSAWGHRCQHGNPCPGWTAVPRAEMACQHMGCMATVKEKVSA